MQDWTINSTHIVGSQSYSHFSVHAPHLWPTITRSHGPLQCKTLNYTLLCKLSSSKNNLAPRNDGAESSMGSHVRKYFWGSKNAWSSFFALESEVLLFCTEKRETYFKDGSFHAIISSSKISLPILLCPKEKSSFPFFKEACRFAGGYQFTARNSLTFTLQAQCL